MDIVNLYIMIYGHDEKNIDILYAIDYFLNNYMPKDVIREKIEVLASLEHERWSKWQNYVHSICIKNEDGSLTIPKERVEHWEWEIKTKYNDLPENLKEYDREEIRVFLKEILGD